MIVCSNCGKEQEPGNFCEACGHSLKAEETQQVQQQETATPTAAEASSTEVEQPKTSTTSTAGENATLEKVKEESTAYWNYFVNRLKNPDTALKNDNSLVSSIITGILLPLAISLFFYGLINTTYKQFVGGFFEQGVEGLPFFALTIRIFFVILLLFLSGLVANFVVLKLAKNEISFQSLLAKYTGIAVPYTALFVILALLSLIGLFTISEDSLSFSLLFSILFSVIILINPIIIVFNELRKQKHPYAYYFSLLSLIINGIILAIITKLFVERLMTLLEEAAYFF